MQCKRIFPLLTVFIWTIACSSSGNGGEHDLILGLQTDLVAGQEFDTVQVILTSTTDDSFGRRSEVIEVGGDFVDGARLEEISGIAEGSYRLDVILEDRVRERLITQRPTLVSVKDNVSLTVPITRSCVNVICPPVDDPNTEEDESTHIACLGGECVDPRCTPESPEFCGQGVFCDEAKNDALTGNPDCPTTAECALGECRGGTCWVVPKAQNQVGACSSDIAWCHPDFSCVALGVDPFNPVTCNDSVQNGDEEGVDCGGALCEACPEEVTCDDGVQNGDEEGVDCGGTFCTACIEETCDDGIQNRDEEGIDCGGTFCDACVIPTLNDDTCIDGVQNGSEEGIDCGSYCTPCPEDNLCFTQTDVPVHECLALLAFYESTGGDSWSNNSGWLSSTSVCSWQGITCSGGQVSQLDFQSNGLTGSLPAEIGNLRFMDRWITNEPSLGGTLPPEIGYLTRLTLLSIEQSGVGGSLPDEIGNLTQLLHLGLTASDFSGSLPTSIGNLSNLTAIYVAHNQLSGTLPSELGSLAKLRTITANNNNITGPLPDIFSTMPELLEIQLGGNLITGSIPASIGSAPRIQSVDLSFNFMTGEVPTELMNPPLIQTVRINNNACLHVTECDTFKPWLDGMDPTWQSSNRGTSCSPPPNACE